MPEQTSWTSSTRHCRLAMCQRKGTVQLVQQTTSPRAAVAQQLKVPLGSALVYRRVLAELTEGGCQTSSYSTHSLVHQ